MEAWFKPLWCRPPGRKQQFLLDPISISIDIQISVSIWISQLFFIDTSILSIMMTALIYSVFLLTCSILVVSKYYQSEWKIVWILNRWLHQKPADLDLQCFPLTCSILVVSKYYQSRVINSVDPDQMALSEASWSGSTVFSVSTVWILISDQMASPEASWSGWIYTVFKIG